MVTEISKQILDKWAVQVVPKDAIFEIILKDKKVAQVNSKKIANYGERGYKGDEVLWIPPNNCLRAEFEDKPDINKKFIAEMESNAKVLEFDYCITGHGGTSDYFNMFNIKGIPLTEDNQNAKLLLADLLMPKRAKDQLDRTNLGRTLSPIIGHPHWKPKYNGAEHKLIRGKNPLEHENEYPEELLKQLAKSKKENKKYRIKTKQNSGWVDDFLLKYCCEHLLPKGARHFKIEKNLAAHIIHRKDKDEIKKKYYQAQERHHDSLRTWEVAILKGDYTNVSAGELFNFIKEYDIPYTIPKEFLNEEEAQEVKKVDPEIIFEADNKLRNKDPLKFMMNTVKKIHLGDKPIVAKLICSGCSSGQKDRRKTIHCLDVGGSGKGKSNAQEATSNVFSSVDIITSCSNKASYYKSKAGLMIDGGIIIFDEAEFSEEGQAFERVITDDKKTAPKHETIVDKEFVEMKITEINAVWKNAVDMPEDQQTLNRYHISVVDESEEQDDCVYDKIVEQYSDDKFDIEEHKDFKICREMTDKIKETPSKIIIPYGKLITSTDKRNRRTIKKFLRLLHAVTYIYRFQRPIIDNCVISTRKDYEIARIIWDANAIIEQTKLTPKQQETLEALPTNEVDAMDLTNIANKVKEATSSTRARLKRLQDFGFVNYKSDYEKTKKYLFWRTYTDLHRLTIDLQWDDFGIFLLNSIDLPTININMGISDEQEKNSDNLVKNSKNKELYEIIIKKLDDADTFWKCWKVGKSSLDLGSLKAEMPKSPEIRVSDQVDKSVKVPDKSINDNSTNERREENGN